MTPEDRFRSHTLFFLSERVMEEAKLDVDRHKSELERAVKELEAANRRLLRACENMERACKLQSIAIQEAEKRGPATEEELAGIRQELERVPKPGLAKPYRRSKPSRGTRT